MKANIPEGEQKRVVIIGGGFAGLTLVRKLVKKKFQIVLIDKHNYHQFQPLLYQVATSGIEPSAISFPYRRIFQSKKNVHIRMTEVKRIDAVQKRIYTSIGHVNYDYLIIASGADTNYFGNEKIEELAYPMKSVSQALGLRNTILQNYENALITEDPNEREGLMNIVVVGGGPTGVEVSGALAEMKKFVLPKDYPELDFHRMHIYLLEASSAVVNVMSEAASKKAYQYLLKLGVRVWLNSLVKDFDGKNVMLEDGSMVRSNTLIWAAGVHGNRIEGLNPEIYNKRDRIMVDRMNRVKDYEDIFAIGDAAVMSEEEFPNGHPQVAQVAIQQARLLAINMENLRLGKELKPFHYKDLGSMATVGRNRAVVDLPFIKFQGFFAWLVWMFIHLMSIVGVKNRLIIFINWLWYYISYDASLRLIIKPTLKLKNEPKN
jgi:NADH dehydrogenase